MGFRNIHVVINLGSGKSSVDVDMIRSRLEVSHAAFRIALIEPDSGPEALARRAIEEGADLAIAAGGDGAVLGTAEGLMGTVVSLGVIPQGTANVFAAEMGPPSNSGEAIALALGDDYEIRTIDTGCVGGKHFLLRVGIGIEAAMTVLAGPELKTWFCVFAYMWTAFRLRVRRGGLITS